MRIYINKNNQQLGPYEDHIVIDQLNSGQLSPTDLGIRQGGTTWEPLGDMFPEAARTTEPSPEKAYEASPPGGPATVPASKGGCRKILGWALLVFGLLMMLGGFGAAIVNRTTDPYLCQQADRYMKEAEEASREVQTARGTPREADALRKLTDKNSRLKISTEACGDTLDYYRWWFFALLAIGGLGLVTAIFGFFIRRV